MFVCDLLNRATRSEREGGCATNTRNLNVLLAVVLFGAMGSSIAYRSLFDIYLSKMAVSLEVTHVNSFVGIVRGLAAVLILVAAMPFGNLVDRISRLLILRLSAAACLVGSLWFSVAVLRNVSWSVVCSVPLIALFHESFSTSALTVFTDSTTEENSIRYFTARVFVFQIGSAAGPLVAAWLFVKWGNAWRLGDLQFLLGIGSGICAASLSFVWCVDTPVHNESRRRVVSHLDIPSDDNYQKYIPAIIVAASSVLFTAVGFAASFVPLYFIEEFGISPLNNSLLLAADPLVAASFVWASMFWANKFGIPVAVLLSQLLGVFAILVLSKSHSFWVAAASLLMRNATMTVPLSLNLALLSAYVPKSARGKWNSLHNMTLVCAMLGSIPGGYMSDAKGYRLTFQVSAGITVVGMCALAPLVWIVKKPGMSGDPLEKFSPHLEEGFSDDMTTTPSTTEYFGECALSPDSAEGSTRL